MFDQPRKSRRSARVGWITDANGCDIWQGCVIRTGYGHVRVGGSMRLVHRVRYEREIGPIPEGMDLDHYVCDNGPGGCCNPHHCRPVTRRENTLRSNSISAQNAAKTHCVNGHPYSAENTNRRRDGYRQCETCRAAHQAKRVYPPRTRCHSQGVQMKRALIILFALGATIGCAGNSPAPTEPVLPVVADSVIHGPLYPLPTP